ncbi:FAD binding domain-containing protein [Neoroseomonas oryzicola]|uniref:Xanthine dehydrogenase family protein subunit M n=1 Tax=Neoroseomonas oryzicola TaxID=535904 RepID=A0A9X9WBY4_9PROT|nr:xanthine dehydrogenase family protein subunit M [Neoroseomonas oryzicola]MBR0657844.1 xanthine dehydrogenase family protein subunit M [Neoroseomonas oryzicola]NKE18588.1 xanthine dehydrogenase family protein subunit M [Neoroseomonas oryzicola]
MKWPAIGYVRATSLEDLWTAQAAHGGSAQVLAGGQTLLATLAFRLSDPKVLIDITRIAALRGIGAQGGVLRIGALTRHAELGRDPLVRQHAPLLAEAVPLIAHPAIRNRGTIGGSLAYADPAAELPACVVALGATIVLASARGERRVAAEDFFTGLLQTALEPGEIIAAVELPSATAATRCAIVEVARRSGDYAMAGLAACLSLDAAGTVAAPRLVFFGVGSGPVLAAKAGAALAGRVLDHAAIGAAQMALAEDLDPPADMHGPPEMKRHLARVLTQRALGRFLPASEIAA